MIEAHIKISGKDLALQCGVDSKTIYNWKKNKKRKRLYSLVMKGLAYEKLLEVQDKIGNDLKKYDSCHE